MKCLQRGNSRSTLPACNRLSANLDRPRVSAAFVGRFRFSHLRLQNQTEEREVKVFRCGVALSSAYYLIFLKISLLVSYLHQFLPAIIVASFIALWRHLSDTYLKHKFDPFDGDKIFQPPLLLMKCLSWVILSYSNCKVILLCAWNSPLLDVFTLGPLQKFLLWIN